MQPRGVNGHSASKISLIVPSAASFRCGRKASRKPRAPCAVVGVYLEPGVDKWADQPGPHRSLVIGRVAGAQVSEIARLEIGLAGRQRAQADRRQQPLADDIQHRLPAAVVEHLMLQREGQ